jgi:thiopeptide-type bacteriocin biosynthesis protein
MTAPKKPGEDLPSLAARLVLVGDEELTLPEFLRRTADQLEGAEVRGAQEMAHLSNLFLGAGVPVLREAHRVPAWIEFRVAVADEQRSAWYGALLAEVRALRRDALVRNFFFVHKQPGLRVRFETGPREREMAGARLRHWLDEQRARGVVQEWGPAVYEPEQHLFGGSASMRSVHRLFTADSLVWLEHHSAPKPDSSSWALALAMLKSLLTELHVHDYEDRDVWDRLREQTYRRFPGKEPGDWARISRDLRRLWHSPDRLLSLLGPSSQALADSFRAQARDECGTWRRDHFQAPGATVGVREAAAFFAVFLWNRARVSLDVQIATSEALVLGPLHRLEGTS